MRRIAVAVRWLSFAWLAGWIIYLPFSKEPLGHDLGSSILTGLAIFAPGVIGLAVGLWLDEFADKP